MRLFFFIITIIAWFSPGPAFARDKNRTISSDQFKSLLQTQDDSLVVLCVDAHECRAATKKADYLLKKSPDIHAYNVRTWDENSGKLVPYFQKNPLKVRCESEYVFIHDRNFFRLGNFSSEDCPVISDSDLVEWVDRLRIRKIEPDVSSVVIPEIDSVALIKALQIPGQIFLIETGAKWCAWCVSLRKELRFVKLEMSEQLQIYSINYDKEKLFLNRQGISTALPGLTLIRNGLVIAKHEGYLPHEAVLSWIEAALH